MHLSEPEMAITHQSHDMRSEDTQNRKKETKKEKISTKKDVV
jgi:hypothetical protein